MGVSLGYSLPLLFLTLFATPNLFITSVNGEECTDPKKSTLMIVFGDSFFDVGYGNNHGLCLPSGNPPFGKSLDSKDATGRFSDGLLVPDYIANYLGLAYEGKVAAYKSNLDIQQTFQGQGKGYASLSLAMAGAGATQLGSNKKSESLENQVNDFLHNISAKFFDCNRAKFTCEQNETLYLFSIGTFDYLSNLQSIESEEDVQKKADLVTTAIVEQVKKIAENPRVHGKRFAFTSVALRYMPVVQKLYHKNDQLQRSFLEKLETTHYEKLKEKLAILAQGQDHIINYSILLYHSMINAIMEEPEKYGFNKSTVTRACCGDGPYKADGCGHLDDRGCNDPTAHVFWDGMHNTQHINREIARIFWNGPTNFTFPKNLQTLAGPQKPRYDFSVNANYLFGIENVTNTG